MPPLVDAPRAAKPKHPAADIGTSPRPQPRRRISPGLEAARALKEQLSLSLLRGRRTRGASAQAVQPRLERPLPRLPSPSPPPPPQPQAQVPEESPKATRPSLNRTTATGQARYRSRDSFLDFDDGPDELGAELSPQLPLSPSPQWPASPWSMQQNRHGSVTWSPPLTGLDISGNHDKVLLSGTTPLPPGVKHVDLQPRVQAQPPTHPRRVFSRSEARRSSADAFARLSPDRVAGTHAAPCGPGPENQRILASPTAMRLLLRSGVAATNTRGRGPSRAATPAEASEASEAVVTPPAAQTTGPRDAADGVARRGSARLRPATPPPSAHELERRAGSDARVALRELPPLPLKARARTPRQGEAPAPTSGRVNAVETDASDEEALPSLPFPLPPLRRSVTLPAMAEPAAPTAVRWVEDMDGRRVPLAPDELHRLRPHLRGPGEAGDESANGRPAPLRLTLFASELTWLRRWWRDGSCESLAHEATARLLAVPGCRTDVALVAALHARQARAAEDAYEAGVDALGADPYGEEVRAHAARLHAALQRQLAHPTGPAHDATRQVDVAFVLPVRGRWEGTLYAPTLVPRRGSTTAPAAGEALRASRALLRAWGLQQRWLRARGWAEREVTLVDDAGHDTSDAGRVRLVANLRRQAS